MFTGHAERSGILSLVGAMRLFGPGSCPHYAPNPPNQRDLCAFCLPVHNKLIQTLFKYYLHSSSNFFFSQEKEKLFRGLVDLHLRQSLIDRLMWPKSYGHLDQEMKFFIDKYRIADQEQRSVFFQFYFRCDTDTATVDTSHQLRDLSLVNKLFSPFYLVPYTLSITLPQRKQWCFSYLFKKEKKLCYSLHFIISENF